MLEQESGGHRIQRVPPTEKRGRVHTSTVTVAVLPIALATASNSSETIKDADITIDWFSGTGKGGQHRNKHQNSCRLKHIPTGIVVTSQKRKRSQSYESAKSELQKRIQEIKLNESSSHASQLRANMVGSGMRADKIRTYRFQDDQVKDHRSGKIAKVKKVMNGNFDLLQ